MRILLQLLAVAILSTNIAHGQCNEFYQFNEGDQWEMATFNAKDKPTGKTQQNVKSLEKTGNGYNAIVTSMHYDEKGKELMRSDLEFKCTDGTIYIDMRNFIPQEQLKAFQSYEMKAEAENLEMPSSLSAGQSLKDGSITITTIGAPLPMKMTVKITDRKVEAKESITTPAGTFSCYKISSNMNVESQFGVKISLTMSSVDWISTKVGSVRSESYNKNGKLIGYTILTSRK